MPPQTTQQAISRAYALLRQPSQEELYFEDARDACNELLAGYVEEMNLRGRDQRTLDSTAVVTQQASDYTIMVAEAPDFEPVRLEFSPLQSVVGQERAWYEARLVPFAAWPAHSMGERVVACIFGDLLLEQGARLKINLSSQIVSLSEFRLSYRVPLLTELQLGDKPPLPAAHLPMLHYDLALDLMPIVRRDDSEWQRWTGDTYPKYLRKKAELREKWEGYLSQSIEPPVQPITPFDLYRRGRGRTIPRGYLPRE